MNNESQPTTSGRDADAPGLQATQSHNPHRPGTPSGSLAGDSIAALISSSAFTVAFYPLHRLKTVMQTQDVNVLVASGRVKRYQVLQALPRLVQEQGMHTLWRGMTPYMLRHIPSTTLSFSFKDMLIRHLPQVDASQNMAAAAAVNVAAGGLAGAMALALVYPLDFASIRMAADVGPAKQGSFHHGLGETLVNVRKRSGIQGLYRGFGASVIAIGAYKALYFGMYDTSKQYLGAGGRRPGLLELWLAANSVVVAASTATYPLDVLRKRLVADVETHGARRFNGLLDCARQTWHTEGIKGLYRFYGVDILLRMGGGVLLVLYDEIKGGMHKAHGSGLGLLQEDLSLDHVKQRLWSQPPVEGSSSPNAVGSNAAEFADSHVEL